MSIWFPTYSAANFTGSVAASAVAGSILQNGWVDNSGNVWSISSGLAASITLATYSPNSGALLRPAAENTVNSQTSVTFTPITGGAQQLYILARHNRQIGTANCYVGSVQGNAIVFYAFVNGGIVASYNSGAGANLVAGVTYIATFTVQQQASPAGTNLSVSIFNTAGIFIGGSTVFDATTQLQSQSGACGVSVYAGAAQGYISLISTNTDIAPVATGYTVTGPSFGPPSTLAGAFTATPNGAPTSSVTVTPSDGGAGGTFSPTSVAFASGNATPQTFNYTPAATPGTVTLSFANSGSLSNAASLAFQVLTSASVTWYPVNSTPSFTGPVAVNATPGATLQSGWIDKVGGIWSILSSNLLLNNFGSSNNTVGAGPLLRPTSENTVDGRILIQYIPNGGDQIWAVARHNGGNASTVTCYAATYNGNGIAIYKFVNGSYGGAALASKTFTNIAAPYNFYWRFDCVQTTGSVTTLTASLYYQIYAPNQVPAATLTYVDGAASVLQGASGALGIAQYNPSSTTSGTVVGAWTFTDIAPPVSGFTFSGPANGVVGTPSANFVVAPNGAVSSSVTVTPSSTGAGRFSPTTLTFASGANGSNSATFSYTPTTQGTFAISIANTGTLANPAAISFQASPVPFTVSVNSAAFVFSPGNWKGDAGRGGSVYRQTWNAGAYFTFVWTAGASGYSAQVRISSPSFTTQSPSTSQISPVVISYYFNGVLFDAVTASADANGYYIQLPTAYFQPGSLNTLKLYLRGSTQTARWNGSYTPINYLRVLGVAIDGGSTAGTATTGRPWGMIVGDSITEGIEAGVAGANPLSLNNVLMCYSALISQMLDLVGYETCISACGYSGWLHAGDYSPTGGGAGDVPPYYVVSSGIYSEAASRWDKIDAGLSILDSAGQISAYGATGSTPTFILINYGANDAIYSTNLTDMQTAITLCLGSLRAAAPAAAIALLVPFGFYSTILCSNNPMYLAAFKAGFNTYKAANPGDANTIMIDLGAVISAAITAQPSTSVTASFGLFSLCNGDVHPNQYGHAYLAPRVAGPLAQALRASIPTFRASAFRRF